MEIQANREEDVHVLRVIGNFDLVDIEAFRDHVGASIDARHSRVVLDAEEMSFVCSAAIGSLLHAQRRLQEHGGDLVLAALPSFAFSVLRTLGLDRQLRSFETLDEAREWLRRREDAGPSNASAER